MRQSAIALAACILAATPIPNVVAEANVEQGASIARESCVRCHNVEPGGPFKEHPPSFASIAVFRSAEQIYGRIVFPPLHSSMPAIGYMLTPENVNHVVAYIMSLEAR